MKIIIIGDGKVGYKLADRLSAENHSITIIDKNAEKLNETSESLNVQGIKGNGVSTKVLLEAGVREADLLIAVTNSDELNMVCCLTAKRLGARHTIARIRDPEYADELSKLKHELGLDLVINPEQAIAQEIVKRMEFLSEISVEMFAKGRVELAEIKVTAQMPITSMTLKEISHKITSSVLIGAVVRDEEVFIPDGEFMILAGDVIHVLGHPPRIYAFCSYVGLHPQKMKRAMIVGGGKIAYYLARYMDEIGVKATIIEIDYDRCVELSEALPTALVIHGDASDDKLMRSEGIADMECLVAITNFDEENFMTAFYAKRCGVPKVIARVDRPSYFDLNSEIGIDHLVSPKEIIAESIARYVKGLSNAMAFPSNTLFPIIGGQAEVVEFIADQSAEMLQIPLKKLKLIKNLLVGIIIRNNMAIIPHGNDAIKLGDSVLLITRGQALSHLNDILAGDVPYEP